MKLRIVIDVCALSRSSSAASNQPYDPLRHPGWPEISEAEFVWFESALIAWRERLLGVQSGWKRG